MLSAEKLCNTSRPPQAGMRKKQSPEPQNEILRQVSVAEAAAIAKRTKTSALLGSGGGCLVSVRAWAHFVD